MTTIAYDGEYLAADGRLTSDTSIICNDYPKIFVCDDIVVTGSGSPTDIYQFYLWVLWGMDPEKDQAEDSKESSYWVFVNNELRIYEDKENYYRLYGPTADGSGWQFALAALDFGYTAKEAVKYAATRDIQTGGKITSVRAPKVNEFNG